MCKQPPPLGKCLVDSQTEYVVYSEVQFKYMNILKSRYSKLTSCKSSLWFHLPEKKTCCNPKGPGANPLQ